MPASLDTLSLYHRTDDDEQYPRQKMRKKAAWKDLLRIVALIRKERASFTYIWFVYVEKH